MKSSILLISIYILSLTASCKEVTLEKKVAQMLIVGMKGTELTPSNPIYKDIKDRGVGGVILFEHNITPVEKKADSKAILRKLCDDLKALSDIPLIISVDQEGGRVNRLKAKYGYPHMPSQKKVAQINNDDTTRYYNSVIAETVKSAGFNVNFAPCTDVDINPACPVIGAFERSYSGDGATVARHAAIAIGEYRKQGVATSLKHFPGHGSSSKDSHLGFTDVTTTWSRDELTPYKILIDGGLCDMVMITHVLNANIDPVYPATLSRITVDSLLRNELGWQGIVITDDMQMKAITNNYSFETAMELVVNAGIDLIIISSGVDQSNEQLSAKAIRTILSLVEKGKISKERIDQSYDRIIKFKEGSL